MAFQQNKCLKSWTFKVPTQVVAKYKVIYSKKAIKALEKLPPNYQLKIKELSLQKLTKNPFSLDLKLMQSPDFTHRLRVGPYRLFLVIDTTNKEVIVATIKLRTTQTYR